mgnify:FL=1
MVNSNVTYTVGTNTLDIGWVANPVYPKPEERKETNMYGLFEVIVVDPSDEIVVQIGGYQRNHVVAKDETSAKIKVLKGATLPKDLDEYDVIVVRLGNVRAKQEIQKVVVVKE